MRVNETLLLEIQFMIGNVIRFLKSVAWKGFLQYTFFNGNTSNLYCLFLNLDCCLTIWRLNTHVKFIIFKEKRV